MFTLRLHSYTFLVSLILQKIKPTDSVSLFKSFAGQVSGSFFCDSKGEGDLIFFLPRSTDLAMSSIGGKETEVTPIICNCKDSEQEAETPTLNLQQ